MPTLGLDVPPSPAPNKISSSNASPPKNSHITHPPPSFFNLPPAQHTICNQSTHSHLTTFIPDTNTSITPKPNSHNKLNMSLRDLTHPPLCTTGASSSAPLSTLADNLLPGASSSRLAQVASRTGRTEEGSEIGEVERGLLEGFQLGGGVTDRFERAFGEVGRGHDRMQLGQGWRGAGYGKGTWGGAYGGFHMGQGHRRGYQANRGAGFAEEFAKMGMNGEVMVEEFAKIETGKAVMSGGAVGRELVGMGWRGRERYVSPWRMGGYNGVGYRAQLVREVARENGGVQEGLKESKSWGDEFTSLEGDIGKQDADREELSMFGDEESFERMYEAVYRDMIAGMDSEREYRFERREQVAGRSALDVLEEAVRMREGGRLPMAVRLFEEALDRAVNDPFPPLEKSMKAKAWSLLGVSLAESDDDQMAIVALRRGLAEYDGEAVGERREDNPYLLPSLLALAVSYTNELDQSLAFGHIKEWFDVWKMGKGIVDGTARIEGLDAAFQEATKAGAQRLLAEMRAAVESNPDEADIYVVMGVLHNLHREYSEAAVVLRQGVMIRPGDPSLWNKLGATLANGGVGDDALRAYRRAVDINPSLVRAWVNVGTAYSNRQDYAKAVRYYLKSIALAIEHEKGDCQKGLESRQDRMAHVWGYLRTSLISMSRADVLHLIDARDVNSLREHFNF